MNNNSTIPKNITFVSAQPDTRYFHWQVELYLYNFVQKGIPNDQCFAIFEIKEKPSDYLIQLKSQYNGIYWYQCEQAHNTGYLLPARSNLLKQFFKQFPEKGQLVFFHDSDILFRQLPDFKKMLDDDICYLSNTIDYIGYNYIKTCCARYKAVYPSLTETDLVDKMASCLNISPKLLEKNELNSGGAQHLLKDINADYWHSVEQDSIKLYQLLTDYIKQYPIEHSIQKWTADMWSVLWNLWKLGKKTKIHDELSFSWATFDCSNEEHGYYAHNIFHLAGVTKDFIKTQPDYFFKGDFIKKNIISLLKEDIHYFDYVNPNNSSGKYIEHAINYVCKTYNLNYDGRKEIDKADKNISQNLVNDLITINILPNENFRIDYAYVTGRYCKSGSVIAGKPIWICVENNKIIFYNQSIWVLTGKQYLASLSVDTGGYLFSQPTEEEPYLAAWDEELNISIESDEFMLESLLPEQELISGHYTRSQKTKNGKNIWENKSANKLMLYSNDCWLVTEKCIYFASSEWKYYYLSSIKGDKEPYAVKWLA